MRFVSLFLLLSSAPAWAVPTEFSYTGQLIGNSGAPITSLGTTNPVGGIRVTFWSGQCTTGTTACDGSATPISATLYTDATLTTELKVQSTYLANCGLGGAFGITLGNCLPVALNSNGVFQLNFFVSPADVDQIFPDGTASTWIQIEVVTVSIVTGAITGSTSSSNPAPVRQRFTATPYAMKVPVDTETLTYEAGKLTLAGGAVTFKAMAAPPVAPAGKARMYFDATENKLKVSENGGAYANVTGGGGGGGFGAWSSGYFSNITYTAPSNGIVTANCFSCFAGVPNTGYTPALTARVSTSTSGGGLTMPVRGGDTWMISSACGCTVSFLPVN